jgi:Tol biopolymer transport system component
MTALSDVPERTAAAAPSADSHPVNGDQPPPEVDLPPPDHVGTEAPSNRASQLDAPRRMERRAPLMGLRAAGVAAILIALVSVAWFSSRQDAVGVQTPTLRKFTFDAAFPRQATWAPDGQAIAYTSDRSGNADIWVQSTTDPNPRRVTTAAAQDWQPHWSPVGDHIAFRSEADGGGLFIVASAGGTPRRLTNFGYGPRWSPDGKLILFSDATPRAGARRLYVIPASGGVAREISTDWMEKLRSTSGFGSVHAGWSPDGHVSIWGRFPDSNWTFLTVSVADGTTRVARLSKDVQKAMETQGLRLGDFVWSPSGRNLYFEGRLQDTRSIWRVEVDPETTQWLSPPERLTRGTTEDIDMALSPDGTRLAFTAQTTQTRVWQFPFDSGTGRLTGTPEPVTPGNAQEVDVDVSEDGRQLAYRALRDGREEIWTYSLPERQERLLLASNTGRRTSPLWSPDGTQLLYARRTPITNAPPDHSVAMLGVLGGNERVLPVPDAIQIDPRDWSGDGRAIVGSCRQPSTGRVGTCLVTMGDEGEPTQVQIIAADPSMNLFCQRFSPDQRWVSFLAINATDPSVSRVYIVPVAGGAWTPVTEGLSYEDKPRWGPDGRTIYFVSNRTGTLNVWGRHIDPSTGTPKGDAFPVTTYASPRFRLSPQLSQMEIAVSRNRLFLPIAETTGAIWILDNLSP